MPVANCKHSTNGPGPKIRPSDPLSKYRPLWIAISLVESRKSILKAWFKYSKSNLLGANPTTTQFGSEVLISKILFKYYFIN